MVRATGIGLDIGETINAEWLRGLRAKAIAEVPVKYELARNLNSSILVNYREIENFWRQDNTGREKVLEAFVKTGATLAAADNVPVWANTQGWTRLGGTGTYIRRLCAPVKQDAAGGGW